MPELHGAQLPSDGLHVAIRYDVPDQPSREALVVTADDVGALLLQRDVQAIFALVSVTPVTWSQVPDGESTLQAIIAINAALLERVTGPASASDTTVARFDGTTGTLIEGSLVSIDDAGNLSTPGTIEGVDLGSLHAASFVTASAEPTLPNEHVLTAGAGISITPGAGTLTIENTAAGASAVQGPASTGATDTAIARFDGATGTLIQDSLVSIDDLGNISTPGTVDGVDVSNLATALANVAVPSYVTLASTPTLGNERVLTAGANITITDGGAGGAVTVASTASGGGAPTTAQYLTLAADATLTNERVLTAGTGVQFTDAGAGGALTVASTGNGAQNLQFGTAYTLALSDAGKTVDIQNAAAITLTVPTDVAVPLPLGTECFVYQSGAGKISIVGTGGVIVNVPLGRVASLAGQRSTVRLWKRTATTWNLDGHLESDASYLTLGTTAEHPNERVLTAGAGITLTDAGAGGALTVAADLAFADNPQAGSYTLTAAAPTQLTRMNSASANDLTVPPDAAAIPLLQPMAILRAGTGITTIKAGAGVTLRPANNLRLITQWDTATVMKIGSNEYLVKGEVSV